MLRKNAQGVQPSVGEKGAQEYMYVMQVPGKDDVSPVNAFFGNGAAVRVLEERKKTEERGAVANSTYT